MLQRRFLAVCLVLASAVFSVADAQRAVHAAPPMIAPPARDIAPPAPSPFIDLSPAAPVMPPTVSYSADAAVDFGASESAVSLPLEVPAYSDLCRAAPKPPWCEDKPASPRTP